MFGPKITRICEFESCGKAFECLPWKNQRFCSRSCSMKAVPRVKSRTKDQEIKIFWSKVNKDDDCWNWSGYLRGGAGGRGFANFDNIKQIAARVSWQIHYGPIPDGLLVCHKCDNPPCVRPEHLFLGTNADNMADCKNKGRTSRGMIHRQAMLDGLLNQMSDVRVDEHW